VSCVPASGSFFPLGVTTVSCSAIDQFGNQATKTFTVDVIFHWFGFLSPISNTGNSEFHMGRTIPVKFKLRAGITNAVANLFVAKLTNGVAGPEKPAVSSPGANQGNLFRFDTCDKIYIFDLSTTNTSMSTGQWLLRVDLHDGETHTVKITLK
jgi:hypothetical protein